ncbi:MAG: DUF3047 domain-containing protein [Candidatus Latescibacterota bacterium]|nr:DUF3047 domain-containing protein [Candidatus Latescibacterota bacterium]
MIQRLLSAALLSLLGLIGPAAASELSEAIARLDALLQAPDRQQASALADQLVRRHVAIGRFTQATFDGYLEESLEIYEDLLDGPHFQKLVAHYREHLIEAYRNRLVADLSDLLTSPGLQGLRLDELNINGRRGRADLRALFPDGPIALKANLALVDSSWKIAEVTIDGRHISAHYRRRYRDAIDESYSLPVLEAQLGERDFIVIDDFTATWDGHRPMDWGPWKDKDKQKPMLYRIEQSGDRHYMTARDSTYSVIVGKFVHWNPRHYPIMTWCWRANALPLGGNEFLDDQNDSAAGLYVIFSKFLGIPKQLKYVWSTTLPEGTVGRRNKIFRPWFFVVESGEAKLGKWTFETVDLEKDYRAKLGNRPANRTIGLGLLTDANSTRSYAEAYSADLRAWTREALDDGRIANHCEGLPKKPPRNARGATTGSAYGAEE